MSWAIVGAVTLVALAIRLVVLQQPVVGDELSTFWIVNGNGLSGVVSTVYSDAEISPPFFFLLAKVFSVFGATGTSVRLPSMVAGVAVIPVFYLIGLRTLGRNGGYLAAAFACLSPFLVYFSANARAYSVMILTLALATLALVVATSENGKWWHWLGWAVASALAVYSHYVGALAVGGQVIWVLICCPGSRWKVIGWSAVAALLFAPWLGGFRADLNSPTSDILQGIQQTGFEARLRNTQELIFLRIQVGSAPIFWSRPDVLLGALGLIVAAVGIGRRISSGGLRIFRGERARGALLPLLMVLAVILGELLLLAIGTDIYGIRNLAPVWAGLPLVFAAICVAAGRKPGSIAAVILAIALGFGSIWLADPGHTGVPYKDATELIDGREVPAEAVIDGSILSPAPQTSLDIYLKGDYRVIDLTNIKDEPDFIEHIYDPYDIQALSDRAFEGPGPVELVTLDRQRTPFAEDGPGGSKYRFHMNGQTVLIPGGWTMVSQTEFGGLLPLTVSRFEQESGDAKGSPGK